MDWIQLGRSADRFGAVAVAVIAMFAAGIALWRSQRWTERRVARNLERIGRSVEAIERGIVEVRSDLKEVLRDLRRLDRTKQIDELHALVAPGGRTASAGAQPAAEAAP
jgi:hypothetical protein